MIDTIQLGVKVAFEIQNSNRLIKRIDINQETGEIFGKYYFNDEILNLTVDGRGFSIKTTLAKVFSSPMRD